MFCCLVKRNKILSKMLCMAAEIGESKSEVKWGPIPISLPLCFFVSSPTPPVCCFPTAFPSFHFFLPLFLLFLTAVRSKTVISIVGPGRNLCRNCYWRALKVENPCYGIHMCLHTSHDLKCRPTCCEATSRK